MNRLSLVSSIKDRETKSINIALAISLLYLLCLNVFANNLRDLEACSAISFMAGPEGTLGASQGAGIVYATLDMERLWYLRSKYEEEDDVGPKPESGGYQPMRAKFGIIHQRRPDFYRKLVEPQSNAYNYFYYQQGLDTWKEEYERVHSFVTTPSVTQKKY